jgi:anti-sigma regulatory factor (Ser/Thr protein kinase)
MSDPSCTHDLVVFGSDDELIDTVAPFVTDGVAAGDRVLVVGDPDEFAALHAALAGPGVEFGGPDYGSPMATLASYQQMCDIETIGGRRVRAIAPIPIGGDVAVRAQWLRYEALVARALGPYRFAGLCLYDTRTAATDLIEGARAVHRQVRGPTGLRPNPGARSDRDVLRDIDTAHPWPEPAANARIVLTVDLPVDVQITALLPARRAVRAALRDTALPDGRAEAFLVAVGEVLTNAVQHGQGPVQIRLLADDDGGCWCTVTDHGCGIGDPYAGIDCPLPGNPDARGAGLWVARQLCDQLTIGDRAGEVHVTLHRRSS